MASIRVAVARLGGQRFGVQVASTVWFRPRIARANVLAVEHQRRDVQRQRIVALGAIERPFGQRGSARSRSGLLRRRQQFCTQAVINGRCQ